MQLEENCFLFVLKTSLPVITVDEPPFHVFSSLKALGSIFQKRCPFRYRRLECKRRKSRNTWGNRQIWPWNEEWSRARIIEFCQENTLAIENTLFQQHKTDSKHGQHQMANTEIRLIIFFAAKEGEALYSEQKQDRELTVAQMMTPYCQIQTEI